MFPTTVSVVIPTKDRFTELYRAIDSVFNQTFQEWELIVVIDTSDLSQFRIICERLIAIGLTKHETKRDQIGFLYEGRNLVKIIRNTSKKLTSAACARNLGIAASKSSLVAFLDSDDEWSNEKLRLQIEFMLENKLWACHTNYLLKINGSN
jgi:teichuronic acid biosynthesis glycosyltransferase TuaG